MQEQQVNQLKVTQGHWMTFNNVSDYEADQAAVSESEINAKSVVVLKEMNKAVGMLEASSKESMTFLFSMTLVLLAIGFIIGAVCYRGLRIRVIKRLDKMQTISESINASKDLTLRLNFSSKDEVGHSGLAFDSMLKGFQELNYEIRSVEQAVKRILSP